MSSILSISKGSYSSDSPRAVSHLHRDLSFISHHTARSDADADADANTSAPAPRLYISHYHHQPTPSAGLKPLVAPLRPAPAARTARSPGADPTPFLVVPLFGRVGGFVDVPIARVR